MLFLLVRWMRPVLGLLLCFFGSAVAARAADKYLEEKTHRDGFEAFGSTQAKDTLVKYWWAKEKFRREEEGGAIFILRADRGKMYLIDPSQKTYVEAPFPFQAPEPSPEAKQLAAMLGSPQWDFKLTEEKKKIGEWNCKLAKATMNFGMARTQMDLWMTDEISLDAAMFKSTMDAFSRMVNPVRPNALYEKLKAWENFFPVSIVSSIEVMGKVLKTTSEITKVEDVEAPASLFELPEGYVKKKFEVANPPPTKP